MCELVLYIGMAVMGIYALATGKIKLTKKSEVTGVPARVIGILLLLPFPLAVMGYAVLGVMIASQLGGQPIDQAQLQQQIQRDYLPYVLGITIGSIGLPVLVSVIIAAMNSKPVVAKRRDDDYPPRDLDRDRVRADDRPRRGGSDEGFTGRSDDIRRREDDY